MLDVFWMELTRVWQCHSNNKETCFSSLRTIGMVLSVLTHDWQLFSCLQIKDLTFDRSCSRLTCIWPPGCYIVAFWPKSFLSFSASMRWTLGLGHLAPTYFSILISFWGILGGFILSLSLFLPHFLLSCFLCYNLLYITYIICWWGWHIPSGKLGNLKSNR